MQVRFKKSSVESGLIVHTMAGVCSTMSRRRSSRSRNSRSVRLRRVRWTSRAAIASTRNAKPPRTAATMKVIESVAPEPRAEISLDSEAARLEHTQFSGQLNSRIQPA